MKRVRQSSWLPQARDWFEANTSTAAELAAGIGCSRDVADWCIARLTASCEIEVVRMVRIVDCNGRPHPFESRVYGPTRDSAPVCIVAAAIASRTALERAWA